MSKFSLLLFFVLLSGCASTTANCTDLRQGQCHITSTRLFLDTTFAMTGPDGLSVNLNSNPNAAATQEAFAAINRLAGLVGTVAAGRLPVPLTQPQPFVPGPDSDVDEPEERSRGRACPAFYRPARVTASQPWMIEGVAHALEL